MNLQKEILNQNKILDLILLKEKPNLSQPKPIKKVKLDDQYKLKKIGNNIKNNQKQDQKQDQKKILKQDQKDDQKDGQKDDQKLNQDQNKDKKNKKKNKKKDKKQDQKNEQDQTQNKNDQKNEISQNWLKFKQLNKSNGIKKEDILQSVGPIKGSYAGVTPILALDCEMVLCETESGNRHELARVSIVNYNGQTIKDCYVRPEYKIVDYLTYVSGITYEHIKDAKTLSELRGEIIQLLKDKKIVGHTINKDLQCLKINLDEKNIRDISHLKRLKQKNHVQSLKKIALQYLNWTIQEGRHSSIDDAIATMFIYRKFEKEIEIQYKKN